MEIPPDLKSKLLSELDFVIRKVNEEPEPRNKLFFLSAAHGAFERTMRFCMENELMIAHALLNVCYGMLMDRFNRLKAGDIAIPLPEDWSKQIAEYLSELRKAIEENQSIYPALEKMIRLAYPTTGPWYYTKNYLESLTATSET